MAVPDESGSRSTMPSVHDNQVLGLPSYGPASLAFDSDGDEGSSALTASRASKGRASSLEDDKPNDRTDGDADGAWASDEDDWDAWDDGGIDTSPSRHMGDERPGVTGGRSSNDEDDEDERAMEHEMKTLALAEGDGHVASEKELRKKLYWRDAMVTGIFVLLWYMFSTLISLYNKWVFGPKYFGFPFPMFMTFCQMLVQFCLASIVRFSMPDRFKPPHNPSIRDYGTRVTPTGVSTALDIGLSNLSLKTITLSLYTMCKSSSLIFVLFFAFLFRLEAFSWKLVSVIGLITAGVVLMAFNTTAVDLPGAMLVFIASALGGLRWALTHSLMIKEELGLTNPFATIFWITPVMALTLAGVSMFEDGWGNVFGSEFFAPERILVTCILIIIPGLLAFSMVASEYYIIQRAGVVPLSVAGVFKEVTTISIASWAFGDELTPVNFAGLFVTMIGIGLFTHHKYQKAISSSSKHGPGNHVDAHGRAIRLPSDADAGDDENVPLTTLDGRGARADEESGPTSSGGFLGGLFHSSRTDSVENTYAPVPAPSRRDESAAASASGSSRPSREVERGPARPYMDPAEKGR